MKYVEHFEQQVSFHNIAKIWRGVVLQSVFFICLFVGLSLFNYFDFSYPEYGLYTLTMGIVLIIPSVWILLKFHLLRRKIRNKFRQINSKFVLVGEDAERIKLHMTAGIFLADAILVTGVAHIVLTSSLSGAAYLWCSAIFFLINYKPCVRYINCGMRDCNQDDQAKQ